MKIQSEQLGIQLMQLIVSKPIIELVSTVMVYKFPELSREAIEAMFSVSELKQTRVYQEARDEGRQEGEQVGSLGLFFVCSPDVLANCPQCEAQIQSLSLQQLETLGEALLDFSKPSDLQDWLQS